mgnify:CR=1 FL=1
MRKKDFLLIPPTIIAIILILGLLMVAIFVSIVISLSFIDFYPDDKWYTEKWYNGMSTRLNMDFNQVIEINFSYAETELKKSGFVSKNLTMNSIHYREFWFFIPTNGSYNIFDAVLIANISGNLRSAWMDISLSSSFPEKEIERSKEWTVNRTNAIAQVCGLTINWTNVDWQLSYQD